jgi:hypothetical protein
MLELEEKNDVDPLCPACSEKLKRVWYQELRGLIGKRYIYFCPHCRKVIGPGEREGGACKGIDGSIGSSSGPRATRPESWGTAEGCFRRHLLPLRYPPGEPRVVFSESQFGKPSHTRTVLS